MRVWGKKKTEDIIIADITFDAADFSAALEAVCSHFDLSKPIVCAKHFDEIKTFSRTVFYQDDFVESISFETLEIEIIGGRKKEQN